MYLSLHYPYCVSFPPLYLMDKIWSMHFMKQLTPPLVSCTVLIDNKIPTGTVNYY